MSTIDARPDLKEHVQQLEAQARRAVRPASPWIVRLGRFGFAAKGLVYAVIGWLALQAAIYGGGRFPDQRGALQSILRQPFGSAMLGLISAGLLGYMAWRLVQAVCNPDREPHNFKGYWKRSFRVGSGVIYGMLGFAALRLLIGLQANRRTPKDWTQILMRQPLGKWIVAVAGLAVIGIGLFRIYKAARGELKKQLVLDGLAARARHWILALGRLGQAARGIVFLVIGGFMFFAGLHTNPEEAKGVAEALAYIASHRHGDVLLGAVAAGLIAYGMFQFVEARYRRIRAE